MTARAKNDSATSIAQPDTNNATYIDYLGWSGPESKEYFPSDYLYLNKRKYYKHLDEYNQGSRNGKWINQPYMTNAANKDLIETIASHAELSRIQTDVAKRWFLSLQLNRWGVQPELVAWGVCAYVVETDNRDMRRAHPQVCKNKIDENFRKLSKNLSLNQNDMIKMYGKIQSKFNS